MATTKIFFLLFIIIYIMGLLRAMHRTEHVRDYVRGKPKWLAHTLAIDNSLPGRHRYTIGEIMSFGVMSAPSAAIDGVVVHADGVPDHKTVEGWMADYA